MVNALGERNTRATQLSSFGSYDQIRAIGEVGIFDIVLGLPHMFIVDIALRVEQGASPFSPDLNVTAQQSLSVVYGRVSAILAQRQALHMARLR